MELVAGPLACWGVLKLSSSLVTAGWANLTGDSGADDDSTAGSSKTDQTSWEWGGDIVITAREKSNQSLDRKDDQAKPGREIGRDLANVRKIVNESRAENMGFFACVTDDLEAPLFIFSCLGLSVMKPNVPLKAAGMSLKSFVASGGDIEHLSKATIEAGKALLRGKRLEVQLSAATVLLSAGYVNKGKRESPRASKRFLVDETLASIIQVFAPVWTDKTNSTSPEGKKILSFLLNAVSCVYELPPRTELTLPQLDKRLLPAFAALCASEPYLARRYTDVASVSKSINNTMPELCLLAGELKVDVSSCETKDEVVQALLRSGTLPVAVSASPKPQGATLPPERDAAQPIAETLQGSAAPLPGKQEVVQPVANPAGNKEVLQPAATSAGKHDVAQDEVVQPAAPAVNEQVNQHAVTPPGKEEVIQPTPTPVGREEVLQPVSRVGEVAASVPELSATPLPVDLAMESSEAQQPPVASLSVPAVSSPSKVEAAETHEQAGFGELHTPAPNFAEQMDNAPPDSNNPALPPAAILSASAVPSQNDDGAVRKLPTPGELPVPVPDDSATVPVDTPRDSTEIQTQALSLTATMILSSTSHEPFKTTERANDLPTPVGDSAKAPTESLPDIFEAPPRGG